MPTPAQTVSENETLLIFSEWRGGSRFLFESQIKAWSHAEIQHEIDSSVSPRCTITAVKVLGADDTVRDISSQFDLRSAEEVYESLTAAE